MQIQIAGTEPGFKAWAVVSSLWLGALSLCAGMSVMVGERLVEQFDTELPAAIMLGMRLGLGVIVLIWCGYMVLLAVAVSQERRRLWLNGLLLGWVVIASGYMGIVTLGLIASFFKGTKSVM